ncbi:hypothetical protein [Streptomyces sp. E-08]|uniref:hypothetical protein n=1 Tax=Streptomyces sp. E-08 TaxID=3404047 RepID=UPI003CF6A447
MPMNVKGRWDLAQGDGNTVALSLDQQGESFSGEATIDGPAGQITESMSGVVTDSDMSFRVGTVLYIGSFAQGRLYGLSIDFQNVAKQVTWFAPKHFHPLEDPP